MIFLTSKLWFLQVPTILGLPDFRAMSVDDFFLSLDCYAFCLVNLISKLESVPILGSEGAELEVANAVVAAMNN